MDLTFQVPMQYCSLHHWTLLPSPVTSTTGYCPSGGMGLRWPAAGFGALNVEVSAWDLLKEVTVIFIISTIVWPQVKQQETHPPINRKLY